MRLRDVIIWFFCVVFAISLLIVAGMQLDFINSQRHRMKLISNEPLKNAPPSLAFATIAMGAFRGLVVDILWMRAGKLQDEGQFFDAKQLAEWITTLQPRFASVWEFHAWNMSYNISVMMPETQPQERWRWVKNGYELLRDRGIPLNPRSILLYRELARIFQHKMGSVSDAVHKYYKLQLAEAMEPLISPADNQYFGALAGAPSEWGQIIEDANITPLIEALESADKVFEDREKFVSNYLSLRQAPARFNPVTFNVIDNFRGTRALEEFDIFAKAYQLRKVWKLDPVLMEELNKTYGPIDLGLDFIKDGRIAIDVNDPNIHLPLDWRHPDAHAIYWAVKGLQVAGREDFTVDETNTDRIVGHSLQNLFFYGGLYIYDVPAETATESSSQPQQMGRKEVFLRPDLRMFEPCNKARLAVLRKYKDVPKRDTYRSFQFGHRNLLKSAVNLFYQAGHIKHAQRLYNQLRRLYPSEETRVSLIEYARNTLVEDLEKLGVNEATQIVQMLLRESYFRYAMRDDNEAFGREKMAQEVYSHYRKKYRDENRINLPDFKLMRYFGLVDFLNDWQYPPELRLSLIRRIGIERPKFAQQLRQQEEKLLKKLEKQE